MIDETIFTGENGLSMDDADREFAKLINLLVFYQQLSAENKQLKQRVAELEEEHERLLEAQEQQKKVDEWASRVTYEGMVEQIAACEDAKERDEARKLIEPLLKRAQVKQFRKDIKEVWQVFGQLWNEKPETLRSYLNKALEQKKSLDFQERLKNILD